MRVGGVDEEDLQDCVHKPGVEQDQFLKAPEEPPAATVKRRKLTWVGHVTTVSPKPCLMAPGQMGDVVVGRENTGHLCPCQNCSRWSPAENTGHLCPCQNCSQWSPAEKTGKVSLLNRTSGTPPHPTTTT